MELGADGLRVEPAADHAGPHHRDRDHRGSSSTRSSTRSGPRSRWACGCSASTTSASSRPAGALYMTYQLTKEAMAAARPDERRPAMDPALAALITSAAGTGAPDEPEQPLLRRARSSSSRCPTARRSCTWPGASFPRPPPTPPPRSYVIVDGDRLDNLAGRFLGDPLLYWMICDANSATDPDELTAQAGRTILIPVASAIPPGARNG